VYRALSVDTQTSSFALKKTFSWSETIFQMALSRNKNSLHFENVAVVAVLKAKKKVGREIVKRYRVLSFAPGPLT
jgi:hypothetical protein